MDDAERNKKLFTEYPHHIAMLVKIAQKAIKEGHIRIEGGRLVVTSETPDASPPGSSDNLAK